MFDRNITIKGSFIDGGFAQSISNFGGENWSMRLDEDEFYKLNMAVAETIKEILEAREKKVGQENQS